MRTPPPPKFPGFLGIIIPKPICSRENRDLRKVGISGRWEKHQSTQRCVGAWKKATGMGRIFPNPENLFSLGNLKCSHFSRRDVGIPESRMREFRNPDFSESEVMLWTPKWIHSHGKTGILLCLPKKEAKKTRRGKKISLNWTEKTGKNFRRNSEIPQEITALLCAHPKKTHPDAAPTKESSQNPGIRLFFLVKFPFHGSTSTQSKQIPGFGVFGDF